MLVHEFLTSSAARLPAKVALVCEEHRVTYRELEQMSQRLACVLTDHGLERGGRVGIHLDNSLEAVVGILGTLMAGGVCVVINPTTKTEKLAYILRDCQASILLMGGAPNPSRSHELFQKLPNLKLAIFCGRGGAPADASLYVLTFQQIQAQPPRAWQPPRIIDLDLAFLIYTSGSTGEPKGVMSDHSNVDFVSSSIIQYLGNREDDVVLNIFPLSFDYGLYQLLMVLKFGGTLVLERSFAYPAAILKRIEAERVTGLPGVPMLFATLLRMELRAFDLSSLRYFTNTADTLPPTHVEALMEKFPGVTLHSMYGLTETKRTLHLPPEQLRLRPGSVGIAIPGTEVWIEDEEGKPLGPGEVGELVVRGRHVMRGYWGLPEESARRFRTKGPGRDRCCHTGDLFMMDEDGYHYFVGRKDDIIKTRGEKVAPKEVESVIHLIPGIVAAVVGVPDPVMGHALKAYVVAGSSGVTEGEILAHCRAHLEDFMVPRFVEFISELPTTASGKVARRSLA